MLTWFWHIYISWRRCNFLLYLLYWFFYIYNRYNKANSNYLKSYDPKEEPKHIIYLEANNLYGYAVPKFLPVSGFKYIDLNGFDLNRYTSNSSQACVLEVDLEYPKELHKIHNYYHFAPGKTGIKRKILSEFQLKTANLYNIPIGSIKKLVSYFDDKINKYSKQWIRWISLRLSDCKNYYLKNYLKKIFCHVYCFNFHSSQNNFFVTHTRFEKSKELKKHNRRTNANSMAS